MQCISHSRFKIARVSRQSPYRLHNCVFSIATSDCPQRRNEEKTEQLDPSGDLTKNIHFLKTIKYPLPIRTYSSLLQLCCNANSLEYLREVHRHVFSFAYLRFSHFLRAKIILMYSKCGSISDAIQVFDEIPQPHYKTFNAMIRGYCMNGYYKESILLYFRMQNMDVRPDHYTFPSLLKTCVALSMIESGRSLHGSAIKEGIELDGGVHNAVINFYAQCGMLQDACCLFNLTSRLDPVTWNILMSGYSQFLCDYDVMTLFFLMHTSEDSPKPNAITIAIVLPVCARSSSLLLGESIHSYAVKNGLQTQTLVSNALLSMYAKCGRVQDDAFNMFDQIASPDVISWNSMISGFAENGFYQEAIKVFHWMVSSTVQPNYATIASIFPVCAHLQAMAQGKEIHCYVLKLAMEEETSVSNALVTFYSRIDRIEEAETIFRRMRLRDLVSWNAIIAGYAISYYPLKALELFRELGSTGMEPDSVTIISVLPVCAELCNLREGRVVHSFILKCPCLNADTSIWNALVSFYSKCGHLEEATQVFEEMPLKDLVSWNSILSAYADRRVKGEVVSILHRMRENGMKPDTVTILTLLSVCPVFGVMKAKEIHCHSVRGSLLSEPTVGNAILDTYSKCNNIEYASRVFATLTERNVVTKNSMLSGYIRYGYWSSAECIFNDMGNKDLTTWNVMLQSYVANGCDDQAFRLFYDLQNKGIRIDTVSVMNILPVCVRLASEDLLSQCHGYSLKCFFDDPCLNGALVDGYSKCGSISKSCNIFRFSGRKDLVTYTAMISGFAMNGMVMAAINTFRQMLESGIRPDDVIMTTVLSACSHSGLIDEGWRHFNNMECVYRVKPTMEHYSCMVDLLARSGNLKEAYKFISEMPIPANANVWGTLLGACKLYHEMELGRIVANHLFDIESENIGHYVVMSNIYAAEGRWDGVEEVRKLLRTNDLRKTAGCSWIEIERRRHIFVAGDFEHPQSAAIYAILRDLFNQITESIG